MLESALSKKCLELEEVTARLRGVAEEAAQTKAELAAKEGELQELHSRWQNSEASLEEMASYTTAVQEGSASRLGEVSTEAQRLAQERAALQRRVGGLEGENQRLIAMTKAILEVLR